MTVQEVLSKGIRISKEAQIGAPAADAGVLLCHVLRRDRAFLYAHGEEAVEPEQESRYLELIARRCAGEPLQYITGHQEFMSLDFQVNPAVLIPRQDTEILVEEVLGHVRGLRGGTVNILDVGTGSGCIAVSLAHYIPSAFVTAVDISIKALETAAANACVNRVNGRISFLQGSLFDRVAEETLFDVIVSNPPYIPTWELEHLQREVRDHEPRAALEGGADGLEFYRRITEQAVRHLKPGGLLAFEVGYGQAPEVCGLMEGVYEAVRTVRDLAGTERVVLGCKRMTCFSKES